MMEVEQGKMEEESGSGRNPLEIPEILENILECLPLEDLKASRLVSKLWRDCGVHPMKKKENHRVRLEYFDDQTNNELAEFVQCLNSVAVGNANFPCSKVFVDASFIRRDKKEQHQDQVLFANFLQKISPWVMEFGLSIELRKGSTTKNAFPLSINFPKLKLLKLLPYDINPSNEPTGNFYRFVTSIMERAPSLRKVEFIDGGHSVGLDAIIKAGKLPFTEMKMYGCIGNSSLEKLSKWNREVKLKSLDLDIGIPEVNSKSLFQLLRSQSDSLETLFLCFCEVSSPILASFPEMPKLKSLTVQLYIYHNDDDENVTFPVISYQRQFPALKTLHLNPWNCEAKSLCKQFIKQEMSPVETIEELTLPRSYIHQWSLIIAQNAIRIFPNVKKLEIAADPAMLPTIFKHWTNLEQLTLRSNGICGSINYMLMGQTRSEHNDLQERIKRAGKDFDWNRLQPGNSQESIVNLQKLRILRFKNAGYSRELEVGRESIHIILKQIRSMKCIDFEDRCYPMEAKIDKSWWIELNEDCTVLWNHV